MEDLGWKDWKPNSPLDKAKSAFIQGVGDLTHFWERVYDGLERIEELLGRDNQSSEEDGEKEGSDEGESKIPKGHMRSRVPTSSCRRSSGPATGWDDRIEPRVWVRCRLNETGEATWL